MPIEIKTAKLFSHFFFAGRTRKENPRYARRYQRRKGIASNSDGTAKRFLVALRDIAADKGSFALCRREESQVIPQGLCPLTLQAFEEGYTCKHAT